MVANLYKRIILICIFLLALIPANAGQLQLQYETSMSKLNLHKPSQYLLADDYMAYNNNGESMYGVVLYNLDVCSKNSYDFYYTNKVKQNYDKHLTNTKEWEYISVPDKEYQQLSENTKSILLFNNFIYNHR